MGVVFERRHDISLNGIKLSHFVVCTGRERAFIDPSRVSFPHFDKIITFHSVRTLECPEHFQNLEQSHHIIQA